MAFHCLITNFLLQTGKKRICRKFEDFSEDCVVLLKISARNGSGVTLTCLAKGLILFFLALEEGHYWSFGISIIKTMRQYTERSERPRCKELRRNKRTAEAIWKMHRNASDLFFWRRETTFSYLYYYYYYNNCKNKREGVRERERWWR